MRVTLCDWRDAKGEPCGERADMLVTFTQEGKAYEADLCSSLHGKQLTANAREAEAPTTPSPYNRTTQLPRAEAGGRKPQQQLVDKIDYIDLRAWAEGQGLLTAGSRGRIKQEIQQRWLDEGSPRPV